VVKVNGYLQREKSVDTLRSETSREISGNYVCLEDGAKDLVVQVAAGSESDI
jgi:hypothetical protein